MKLDENHVYRNTFALIFHDSECQKLPKSFSEFKIAKHTKILFALSIEHVNMLTQQNIFFNIQTTKFKDTSQMSHMS